jgi:predicted glycogen debranching enzyme
MGTALGVPRKKYHTLLNAAANPPVDRIATVHRFEESIRADRGGAPITLGGWVRAGEPLDAELAQAGAHLVRFERAPTFVRWSYAVPGAEIVKTLRLAWRRGAGAVTYDVRAERTLTLSVRPWVSVRDMHDVLAAPPTDRIRAEPRGEREIGAIVGARTVRIGASHGRFAPHPARITGVFYDRERERWLPDTETLDSPGAFEVPIAPGTHRITVAFALRPHEPDLSIADNRDRENHLDRAASALFARRPSLAPLRPLLDGADDFLATRAVEGRPLLTVLAGFPWFADWGRDTMISLQGLMLASGRHDDAFACLSTFARYVSEGMIPNHFDDHGGPPSYNTVDASLWFLHACAEYLRATGDRARFDDELLPACHEIIDFYQRGTRYGIRMDPSDGLITAGDDTTQLTWMDAKRNSVVFTPRHGKAVEINVLWHHGLVSISNAIAQADPSRAPRYRDLAAMVRTSFNAQFHDPATGGLYDCLRPDSKGLFVPSGELRPNQIFAVSLEHSPIDAGAKRRVLGLVRDRLLTPVGLRTLAPGSPNYHPRFAGDMMARDNAYHNGTVWPWLIGPFVEAHLRVNGFSEQSRREAVALLQPLNDSMRTDCLGQIAEVLDGDEPRFQQGCTAQAWSVAEVFRAAAMAIDPSGARAGSAPT